MKLKSKKGFTLVELIIVIAILAVIAAIAAPAVTKIFNQSRVDSDKRSAEQIIEAARITATQLVDIETTGGSPVGVMDNDLSDILLEEKLATEDTTSAQSRYQYKLQDNIDITAKPKSKGATKFILNYDAENDKFEIEFTVAASGSAASLNGTYKLIEDDVWEIDTAGEGAGS